MASSGTADDSFRDRVDKIFGSLTSSSTPPSSYLQSTLWSLTDDEVERKQWRRDTSASNREDLPCSSSFDDLKKNRRRTFRGQLEADADDDLMDEDVPQGLHRSHRGGEDGIDEWEIRSSIGLDCTLDNEEEEDEFDLVASGREDAGERLYMKNVNDQESYLNFHNVFSKSLHSSKDSRANHLAAKVRLQEDKSEAQKLSSPPDSDAQFKDHFVNAYDGDGGKLRPILKRKDNSSDSKLRKRVRFDPVCAKEAASETFFETPAAMCSVDTMASNNGAMSVKNPSEVPGYLRDPSKYTCYSFDSSVEHGEKSSSQACMDDVHKVITSSAAKEQEDGSAGLPKSVTFVPKKKAVETKGSEVREDNCNQSTHQLHHTGLLGIAAIESELSEAGSVEDEPESDRMGRRGGSEGRRYRTKLSPDDNDS